MKITNKTDYEQLAGDLYTAENWKLDAITFKGVDYPKEQVIKALRDFEKGLSTVVSFVATLLAFSLN